MSAAIRAFTLVTEAAFGAVILGALNAAAGWGLNWELPILGAFVGVGVSLATTDERDR